MLKRLFTIPDTFDPDDRRRRQILNILLLVQGVFAFSSSVYSVFIISCNCVDISVRDTYTARGVFVIALLQTILYSILLAANRSTRIPSGITGTIFVMIEIFAISQADGRQELYNGRSLIFWVLPIMMGTIILRPEAVFAITAIIAGLMQINPPPDGVNYYAMAGLFLIAFLAWLGMSIANRAIRDARRHAANNEAILNNIADGVLVLDQQGSFFSANPSLLKMIPRDELDEIIAGPLGTTLRWKHKTFSISASDVPEIGTVLVFRDETRRFEADQARDALLAVASHELRTPLTAVMNYLEMLQVFTQMGRVGSDEFNEYIARALENLKLLHGLVNNILDQAQIQAGGLTLKYERFVLRSMIEKVHQLLAVLLTQKNLSYDVEIAPEVPEEIKGDAGRLHQVLVNLLGNAIKFTNKGGVKVRVTMPLDEQLSIEVADTGPGIPPEQLPDIFEAFRRGSNYAQREQQGAGLGLSIAKEIITRMGGKISVSSQPGTGSVFTVLIPMG
jgi:signal transduction histidine kinase